MATVNWQQTFGTTTEPQSGAIALGPTGEIYVGGSTLQTDQPAQSLIAAYSQQGQQKWQQVFDFPTPNAVTHLAVAGDRLIVAGVVNTELDSPFTETWLANYSLTGEQLSFHKLRSVHPQRPDSLIVDGRGFIYLTGHTTPTDGEPEGWLEKQSPEGDRLWQTSLGQYTHDVPLQLWLGEDPTARTKFARAALYVAGSTAMPMAETEDEQQTWLARYSSEGIQRWITALGPAESLSCTGLVTDATHQLYVVGQTQKKVVWIAHYDAQGEQGAWNSLKTQQVTHTLLTPTGLQLLGVDGLDAAQVVNYDCTTGTAETARSLPITEKITHLNGAITLAEGLAIIGQTQLESESTKQSDDDEAETPETPQFQQWVAQVSLD